AVRSERSLSARWPSLSLIVTKDCSDLETWVSVRETPVGTSRDARVSDLSPGAGPEGCGQGSGGCPGGTVVTPGVALRRSPRSAGRAEAGLLKPGQRC